MEQPLRLAATAHRAARYPGPRLARSAADGMPVVSMNEAALPGRSIRIAGFRQRDYGGVGVELVDYRPDSPIELDLGHRPLRLLVILEEVGDHVQLRHDLRFAPLHSRGALQNMILIAPGQQAHLCAQRMQFLRLLTLSFPDSMHGRAPAGESLRPRPGFFDASLQRLAELFVADLLHDETASIGNSLVAPLLARLSQLTGNGDEAVQHRGLAAWQLRRVSDLMRSQLDQQIALQTLADSIGMSRSHFCRAFRASVGMPPHQWHLQMRVAKAKEMLLSRTLPLSEIALVVGFADQAHFTRTFRRTVGATPGTWQRGNAF